VGFSSGLSATAIESRYRHANIRRLLVHALGIETFQLHRRYDMCSSDPIKYILRSLRTLESPPRLASVGRRMSEFRIGGRMLLKIGLPERSYCITKD
jgi:hypothetical protein